MIRLSPQHDHFAAPIRRLIGSLGCVVATLGLVTGMATAQPLLNASNGHYYEAVSVPAGIVWPDARDAAKSRTYLGRQGHLATITSAAEQTFIVTNLSTAVSNNYILGGYQDRSAPDYSEPAGGWRWVTGEPWVYTAWNGGEPNDGVGQNEGGAPLLAERAVERHSPHTA